MVDLQLQDYFLITGIFLIFVTAVLFMVYRRKKDPARGCCSSCSSCSAHGGCPSAHKDRK